MGPRSKRALRMRARGSLLGLGTLVTAVFLALQLACAAGTLPAALVAYPCAGRGRLPASSFIRASLHHCIMRALAWASSQRRVLRSRKERRHTRGKGRGSRRPQEGPGGRSSTRKDGGGTVGAVDVFLAPRFAPASTVQCRPIIEQGEVAVADTTLAPGSAATPTSPGSLRIQATARSEARVTGVAILMLSTRLLSTSVTPMAMG